MLYLAIFCIAAFLLFEYAEAIYKETKYYKDDVFTISYVGLDESSNKLKIKDL
jgi:hypothetical protein